MIVMGVIRKRARVHVMARYAVRVQHAGEEKRGDHGFFLFCQALELFCGRSPLQRSHVKPLSSNGGFPAYGARIVGLSWEKSVSAEPRAGSQGRKSAAGDRRAVGHRGEDRRVAPLPAHAKARYP